MLELRWFNHHSYSTRAFWIFPSIYYLLDKFQISVQDIIHIISSIFQGRNASMYYMQKFQKKQDIHIIFSKLQ